MKKRLTIHPHWFNIAIGAAIITSWYFVFGKLCGTYFPSCVNIRFFVYLLGGVIVIKNSFHYSIDEVGIRSRFLWLPLRRIFWKRVSSAQYMHEWRVLSAGYATISGHAIVVCLDFCSLYFPDLDPIGKFMLLNMRKAIMIRLMPGQKERALELFAHYYPDLHIQPKKQDTKWRRKRIITWASITVAAAILLGMVVGYFFVLPVVRYNNAEELFAAGQYEEAAAKFEELGDYKDAADRAAVMHQYAAYSKAEDCYLAGQYKSAEYIFDSLGNFQDSRERALEMRYLQAIYLYESGEYEEAAQMFEELGDYKDAHEKRCEARYCYAEAELGNGHYVMAYRIFEELGSYKDAEEKLDECIFAWLPDAFESKRSADGFKATVSLGSEHYEAIYRAVIDYINSNNEFAYWNDSMKNSDHSSVVLTILKTLPEDYEDVGPLCEVLTACANGDINNATVFIQNNGELIRQMWHIEFLRDYFTEDYAFFHYLIGTWTADGQYYLLEFAYYEGNTSLIQVSSNLPAVARPSEAVYYDIESMIFYWVDQTGNKLAEVYRFALIDFDTIEVYCYYNEETYTLKRQ